MDGLDEDSRSKIPAIAMPGCVKVPERLMKRVVKDCMMENLGRTNRMFGFSRM